MCGNWLSFPVPVIPLREERWKPGAISNDNFFVRTTIGGLCEHV